MGCTEATGRSWDCHTRCDGYKEFQAKKRGRLTLTKIDEIAEALNCGRFDIFKSVIDPSNIKLNDELINNALESCKALASTATDVVIIAALLQLMSYRATGLAPDQVDEMKKRHEKIELMQIEYDNICEKYDKLYGKEQM